MTHHSLPLGETASRYWVSRSRTDLFFFEKFVFPRILSFKTKTFCQKSTKNHQKFFARLRPAPPPYGAEPLPPTKVGAKCLAAVVLDNQNCALRR